ncbi:MAG: insulinase family protein, partial [Acidobacteriota bacterium]
MLRAVRVPGALVSMRAWLIGGSRLEPTPGLALLAGRGLGEGTLHRSWEQLALDTEDRGMGLQTAAGTEAQAVSINALAVDLDAALDTFVEVVREPAFPDERLRWLARQAAAELDGLLDSPEARVQLAFLDQLYRPHPYGRPLHGLPGDLAHVEPDACADFHRRCLAW